MAKLLVKNLAANQVVNNFNNLSIAANFSVHRAMFSKRLKDILDYSRVPTLQEGDLEEQYITGSGPGGSHVNKNSNCVFLKHKPSGIGMKCHESRLLHENRKLAREYLIEKLDEHYNGDMSIKNQKQKLQKKKSVEAERKNQNLAERKKKYLEHIKMDTDAKSLPNNTSAITPITLPESNDEAVNR